MTIEVRKLTPDLVGDYVNFFDTTPHADNTDEHKCYCVWWCNDDYEGKDGWCNANTKADCLKCYCWRRFMGFVSTEESTPDIKVKSVSTASKRIRIRRLQATPRTSSDPPTCTGRTALPCCTRRTGGMLCGSG